MKNNKITTSKEVIDCLKKNLKKESIISMFVAGSQPENLGPQSDFDIFIVVKSEKRNKFFSNLKRKMDYFVKNRNGVRYSLFRGPIKYKNKGLIHFSVYLDKQGEYDKSKRVVFTNELKQILFDLRKHNTLIYGKNVSSLLKSVKFSKKEFENDRKSMIKHYAQFKKQKTISYGAWKPVKGKWLFVNRKIHPSKFLIECLNKYYSKRLKAKPKP